MAELLTGAVDVTNSGGLEPYGSGEDPGTSVELLAAALRADAGDLEVYGAVLASALGETLPPGVVGVQRHRSLGDRLAGREGRVVRVDVGLGERRLVLLLDGPRPVTEIVSVVRGVVLSRRAVDLDEWLHTLARAIAAQAQSDARSRAALERFLMR